MRACGACFYFQLATPGVGECYNRPPQAHVVAERNGNGDLTYDTIAVRPPVRSDEYCSFFAHKAASKFIGDAQ
jgi:hypothetical protein